MGSGSARAPNFGCVRGTKPSFFTFAQENSGVQPLSMSKLPSGTTQLSQMKVKGPVVAKLWKAINPVSSSSYSLYVLMQI